MRRLTGWLALIVVLGGLGVLVYEDVRMRSQRTEMPSAITAGLPEGAGDEPAETTPAIDSTVGPGPTTDASTTADAPAAGGSAPDMMASAGPPAEAEPLTTSDARAASKEAPEAPRPADVTVAAPPASAPAEVPEEAAQDLAGTEDRQPDEPDVAAADAVPAREPEAAVEPDAAETAPDAADPVPEPAPGVALVAPETTEGAPETPPEVASAPEPEPAREAPALEAAAAPGPETDAVQEASAPDGVAESPAPMDDKPVEAAAVPDAPTEVDVAVAPEVAAQPQEGPTPPTSESAGRDSMMQAATEPPPAGAERPTVAADTPPDAAETVVAAVDPAADVEAPHPAAAPEAIAPGTDSETAAVVPSFDVVRIEPTGEAVIAGVAAPGATVELTDGASTVATAVASDTGDWAIALDRPLPSGQHDLGIRATSEDTGAVIESDQRIAVLVPETPAEEPLVVLNMPDAPSTILQVPAAPETGMADVAAPVAPPAEIAAAPGPGGQGGAVPADEPAAALPPAAVAAPAAPETDTGDTVAEPAMPEPAAAGTDIAAAPVTTPDAAPVGVSEEPGTAAVAPDAVLGGAPQTAAGAEPGAPDMATAEDAAGPAEASPETAAAEPEPEPEPVVAPVVAVTAVEAETSGALFVAGTATTPEDVRVYVDGMLLGEVTPSPSGTWLLEVQRELPAGTYQVRADQVEPGAGTVLARAEVPFEREVEVAVLRPVAEAGGAAGAEATGTMAGPTTLIIKRRDNLWRISRQLYGKGIRWSTIYQANKDQIRNPRWIYPGQVFVVPEGNVAWEKEDGGKPN